jgi:hypothetical protein
VKRTKINEEPPAVELPDDISKQNSPVEPPTLVDCINNPFLEKDEVDDILMTDDVDDLCFMDGDPADDINKITVVTFAFLSHSR